MRLATKFEISVVLVFSSLTPSLHPSLRPGKMDERVLAMQHAKLCRNPNMTQTKTK